MGKTTGFLEYVRKEDPARPPEERVGDWNEFHLCPPQRRPGEQPGRPLHELRRALLPDRA